MTVEIITAVTGGLVLIINAVGAIIIAVMIKQDGEVKNKKLDEIHVLVNSRLTEALEKIESLEKGLKK